MAQDEASTTAAHARVLDLLREHGWNATSFQVLEPGYLYSFDEERDAVTAYVDTGAAWVAAGAPIASGADVAAVGERFVAAAHAAGRRAAFAVTEPGFVEATSFAAMRIGEQPSWDPRTWSDVLRARRSLREQLRRARAKGVRVRSVFGDELAKGAPIRRAVDVLVAKWLASRAMAPLGFLARVHLWGFPSECRFFVAEQRSTEGAEPRVVGFLSAVPVYRRGGWFLEDMLRDPSAPNGTSEALVDALMRAAAAEGSSYVTLGLSPLGGDVGAGLRVARWLGSALYDFGGLHRFKAKLRPSAWSPIYLSFPSSQGSVRTLVDMLGAFSTDGMMRFGLRTLLRGPRILLQLLGATLVMSTVALALADPRWFPSAVVQSAWVAFEAAMAGGLVALSVRPVARLAALLTAAAAADSLLTLSQLVLWNASRLTGAADVAVAAITCSAPLLLAVMLAGAYRRLSLLGH